MTYARVTKSAGRSTYIASPPSDAMTVWALKDFVAAITEAGVPDNVKITAHHSETRWLTHLSLRYDETLDFETGALSADAPASVADVA